MQHHISYLSCLCQEGETDRIYLVRDRHTVQGGMSCLLKDPSLSWALLEPEELRSHVSGGCNSPGTCRNGL